MKTFSDKALFDFETYSSALRYFDGRMTAAAGSYPGELAQKFWGPEKVSKYNARLRYRIANQFLDDHTKSGEHSWDHMKTYDREPWIKFWNFCWGAVHGFKWIRCSKIPSTMGSMGPDGRHITMWAGPAFKPESWNVWFVVSDYLLKPNCTPFIFAPDVLEVDPNPLYLYPVPD